MAKKGEHEAPEWRDEAASEGSDGMLEQPERVAELTQDLQRVQAEFVNFKRRAEAERAELMELAKGRTVREFLTVRDAFDQELEHRPADVDAKWAAAIDAIRAQFDAVLGNLGVARFASVGRAFDPRRHEAVVMEDGDGEHEVVTAELQPGYERGGQTLRHAVVRVGRSDAAPVEGPASEEVEED